MPRKRARNTEGEFMADNPATTEVNEAWVETPVDEAPAEVEAPAAAPAPVELELKDPTPAPEPVSKAPEKAAIETDVRTKLDRKTEGENPFVPQNSAKIEAEAKKVAQEKGFDLNRGNSIGARLMARRRLG